VAPADLLDRARSAATQKERIDLLEKLLASRPESEQESQAREMLMREYALRGEQYLREGSPQLAVKDFKSVLRVAPATINDRVFGQFIFPMPIAVNAFGYRTESADLMRSFEARFQNDANRLVQIGFFYVQIEAPLEAVRVLEQAASLAPQDHRVHNSLGTAYLVNLRLEDAATEFERALALNPKDEYANLNLANLARAGGDHDRAVSFYRKQLEVKPDDGEAYGGLSISLLALGRDEEAERAIKSAMTYAPENYRFLTQLAYFYITRKKPLLARPLIEQSVRIEPRYAWTHIVKANLDFAESKFGDGLSTIIAAQTLGSFATLNFEVVKALMGVDGYDQAVDVMSRTFDVSAGGEFETLLGGAAKVRSQRLDLLLERERKAALFLNEQLTTGLQYRLAEALGRIDHYAKAAAAAKKYAQAPSSRRRGRAEQTGRPSRDGQGELANATRPRRATTTAQPGSALVLTAGRDASLQGMTELLRAVTDFSTLDDGRQAFRMLWAARKLTELGVALDAAEQLALRAITLADSATEPEGSMRDAPLLDREGRRLVFLGRAHDALGWTLFKKGDTRGAIDHLAKSVNYYPPNQERKSALWHLAVATAEAGDERRALDFYIASYEPESPTATARRAQIEALYKKVNGSLAGLEERLKRQ
jgi:tetratricopeptide (TPR) repeat protein